MGPRPCRSPAGRLEPPAGAGDLRDLRRGPAEAHAHLADLKLVDGALFAPSFVSYERWRSRPVTIARVPRVMLSATFSAACRHTLISREGAAEADVAWACKHSRAS